MRIPRKPQAPDRDALSFLQQRILTTTIFDHRYCSTELCITASVKTGLITDTFVTALHRISVFTATWTILLVCSNSVRGYQRTCIPSHVAEAPQGKHPSKEGRIVRGSKNFSLAWLSPYLLRRCTKYRLSRYVFDIGGCLLKS